ncbi:Ni/Fe-hydrogenase 1 b-type cytochrome subunit HyaC2, partial [Salmonella enterica subsp. enterica serovar Heidelberg str. SARA36]
GFRYDDDDSEVSMHLKEITSQGYYIYELPRSRGLIQQRDGGQLFFLLF